jgi:hypothetical protein
MSVKPIDIVKNSRDWLRSPRTSALAWWVPQGAIVVSLFVPVPLRTVIWIIALMWMRTACIFNAKRCGRTHCRYTGPFILLERRPLRLDSCATSFGGRAFFGRSGYQQALDRVCLAHSLNSPSQGEDANPLSAEHDTISWCLTRGAIFSTPPAS